MVPDYILRKKKPVFHIQKHQMGKMEDVRGNITNSIKDEIINPKMILITNLQGKNRQAKIFLNLNYLEDSIQNACHIITFWYPMIDRKMFS